MLSDNTMLADEMLLFDNMLSTDNMMLAVNTLLDKMIISDHIFLYILFYSWKLLTITILEILPDNQDFTSSYIFQINDNLIIFICVF
jgi:hypothetical protein